MTRRAARLPGFSVLSWVIVCISLFILSQGAVCADIYKYVDKDGVLHYTNVPTQASSKVVSLPPATPENINRFFPAPVPALPYRQASDQTHFDPHIRLICQAHGLDYNLVKAVIRAESAFDPQAVSPKGAKGLMQLMPGTSRDLGVVDPFDPHQNIDGGTRYLKMLLDRFNNNLILALAAYNAGPESVAKYGGVPPYDETQIYVRRVLEFYTRYSR